MRVGGREENGGKAIRRIELYFFDSFGFRIFLFFPMVHACKEPGVKKHRGRGGGGGRRREAGERKAWTKAGP